MLVFQASLDKHNLKWISRTTIFLNKEVALTKESLLVSTKDRISAFHPQGPGFDPQPYQDMNFCVTLFSAKANSDFHPCEVNSVISTAGS